MRYKTSRQSSTIRVSSFLFFFYISFLLICFLRSISCYHNENESEGKQKETKETRRFHRYPTKRDFRLFTNGDVSLNALTNGAYA